MKIVSIDITVRKKARIDASLLIPIVMPLRVSVNEEK